MTTSAVPLRVAVGRRVRELREADGARQEDISTAARDLGLTWSRSKVAALERGEKALSGEEILLLPAVLSLALTRKDHEVTVTLADVLTASATIELTPRVTTAPGALPSLLGRDHKIDIQPTTAVEAVSVASRTIDRVRALGLNPRMSELGALRYQSGEAEATAARKLGEPLTVVLAVASALWGRSLSAERDARSAPGEDADAASVRAKRGRITRQLIDELSAEIERRTHGEHQEA